MWRKVIWSGKRMDCLLLSVASLGRPAPPGIDPAQFTRRCDAGSSLRWIQIKHKAPPSRAPPAYGARSAWPYSKAAPSPTSKFGS